MNYDDQYYILTKPLYKDYPHLVPNESTASRKYKFDPLPTFSEAVFFQNSIVSENPELKSQFSLYPLLMTSTSFLAVSAVKDYLTDFVSLKGMHFHPAVYIASEGEWHEDYWFLNIYSELDCWDREKSIFEKIYEDDDDLEFADIEKYILDTAVLDSINEDDRLIFRMGGTSDTPLFVHQRIIDYFEEASVTGYRAFKVSDYKLGMEFRP